MIRVLAVQSGLKWSFPTTTGDNKLVENNYNRPFSYNQGLMVVTWSAGRTDDTDR